MYFSQMKIGWFIRANGIFGSVREAIEMGNALVRRGKAIPSDENFGHRIEAGDISGIGFCYHSKYNEDAQWEPWRRGDYRVIKNLSAVIPETRWVDRVFSAMDTRIDIKPKPVIDVAADKARRAEFATDINAKVALRQKERAAALAATPPSTPR